MRSIDEAEAALSDCEGCDQHMMRWRFQHGARRRRDEEMWSIDEAEAAPSD